MQLNEKENDRTRLEDYPQKTEVRNVELEATIRTLYRNIDVMADSNQLHPVNVPPQYTRMQNTEAETLTCTIPDRIYTIHRLQPCQIVSTIVLQMT